MLVEFRGTARTESPQEFEATPARRLSPHATTTVARVLLVAVQKAAQFGRLLGRLDVVHQLVLGAAGLQCLVLCRRLGRTVRGRGGGHYGQLLLLLRW